MLVFSWVSCNFTFFLLLKPGMTTNKPLVQQRKIIKKVCLRKKYAIQKRQQNLIDLKLQFSFTIIMTLFIFIDHLKNLYLQENSEDLGPEKSFKIWWHQFYFENISMQSIYQIHSFKA